MVFLMFSPDDPHDSVRLGDRLVPRRGTIEVRSADGQPSVTLVLEVFDDRPQCREVRITSASEGREVRQRDLDAVRLADLVEAAFALSARHADRPDEHLAVRLADLDGAIEAIRRSRKGVGARKITPTFLREVAAVYKRNADDKPTQAVATAFGLSHSTAAEYVRRARAHRFLPPTTPGKRRG